MMKIAKYFAIISQYNEDNSGPTLFGYIEEDDFQMTVKTCRRLVACEKANRAQRR